jgi:hypothetical protein
VFDYSKIADSPKISKEQARLRFSHIEMNPPEGELVILATIFEGHVAYSIPYWYEDARADHAFSQLLTYLKAVRETAGFLTCDPQSNRAFDPLSEEIMFDNADYKKCPLVFQLLLPRGCLVEKSPVGSSGDRIGFRTRIADKISGSPNLVAVC